MLTCFGVDRRFCSTQFQSHHTRGRAVFGHLLDLLDFRRCPRFSAVAVISCHWSLPLNGLCQAFVRRRFTNLPSSDCVLGREINVFRPELHLGFAPQVKHQSYCSGISFFSALTEVRAAVVARQLHPLVPPQVSHFRHVPLRTMVKLPHSLQLSPSYPFIRAISRCASMMTAVWAEATPN